MNNNRQNRGITLIALVITIIVLLILAGVSIALLTGENGILTKASTASEETKKQGALEKVKIAVQGSYANNGKIEYSLLEKNLNNIDGIKGFTKTDTDNNGFSIIANLDDYKFYINDTGKVSKVYLIKTAEELKSFRDEVNNGRTFEGETVYLENDIQLDINEEWTPIGIYPNENSTPADETNIPFKGTFDGGKHEISGIYINTTDKVQGLFGFVTEGTILNLGIGENCNINGGISTGSLAGYLYNNCKIVNCYNKADLNFSYATCGGLVAQLNNSEAYNCYNTGNITSSGERTAGVFGTIYLGAKASNCYNLGNITSTANFTGGVAARVYSNGILSESYNNETISSANNNNTGGVVGKVDLDGIITDCYNKGNVSSDGDYIGGVVGHNQLAVIEKCYNIGQVSGDNANEIGGILGRLNNAKVTNSYYLQGVVNSVNEKTYEGVVSKTESEMKKIYTDLGEKWKQDTENKNNGYPILIWQ